MLRQLNFSNFKTWERAELGFGRITGLFGTNSSGKSSLLQFLLLLKQTKEATDRAISLDFNGPYVALGVYRDVVHAHDEGRSLSWDLAFERERDLVLIDPESKRTGILARDKQIRTSGTVSARDPGPSAERLEYQIGDLRFRLAPKTTGDTAYELTSEGGGFKFRRTQGRPWQLPGPIKSYAFPDQARTLFPERVLPVRSGSRIRGPNRPHLLSRTAARTPAARLPMGALAATRCRSARRKGD